MDDRHNSAVPLVHNVVLPTPIVLLDATEVIFFHCNGVVIKLCDYLCDGTLAVAFGRLLSIVDLLITRST